MSATLPTGDCDDEDGGVLSVINTTSLVDVMLVLLIIFLITIPVVTASIPVSLPRQAANSAPPDRNTIIVTVDREGALFWNDAHLADPEALRSRLQHLAATSSAHPAIQVRGDGDVRFEAIAGVIALCREAGISQLGFATQPPAAP